MLLCQNLILNVVMRPKFLWVCQSLRRLIDVYKRQIKKYSYDKKSGRPGYPYNPCKFRATCEAKRICGTSCTPVSYTHLDVYKRQDIMSLRCPLVISTVLGLWISCTKYYDFHMGYGAVFSLLIFYVLGIKCTELSLIHI